MAGEFHEQQEEQPKSDYEILGLPEGASPEEIKVAYRKKVKETHVDAGGNEAAFRRVDEAYKRLTKPKKAPIEGDPLDPAVQEAVEKRGKAKQYDAKYRENQDDPDADPSLWGED